MSQSGSNDRTGLSEAKVAVDQHTPAPDNVKHRWKFRVAVGLFSVWLMYLVWVAMKVISR